VYACQERCGTAERYLQYYGYTTERRTEVFPNIPDWLYFQFQSHCYLRWSKGKKHGHILWINYRSYGKDLKEDLERMTKKAINRWKKAHKQSKTEKSDY